MGIYHRASGTRNAFSVLSCVQNRLTIFCWFYANVLVMWGMVNGIIMDKNAHKLYNILYDTDSGLCFNAM
jgi:hypothetical protein